MKRGARSCVIRQAAAGEVRKIFHLLADATIDLHSNWKGRFKENSDKMRTGSLFEVAVVFKGLSHLARKKTLSFREKRMLDRAKFLLVSEIAEVERASMPSVEDKLDKALTKSAAPQAKPVQKPVAPRRTSDA